MCVIGIVAGGRRERCKFHRAFRRKKSYAIIDGKDKLGEKSKIVSASEAENTKSADGKLLQGRRYIFVNSKTGSDAVSGESRFIEGARGPKKTVQGAMSANAHDDSIIIVEEGEYEISKLQPKPGQKIIITPMGNVKMKGQQ